MQTVVKGDHWEISIYHGQYSLAIYCKNCSEPHHQLMNVTSGGAVGKWKHRGKAPTSVCPFCPCLTPEPPSSAELRKAYGAFDKLLAKQEREKFEVKRQNAKKLLMQKGELNGKI